MDDSHQGKKDEQIAALVQSGNIELFGVLIKRYQAKMERYARRFMSGKEDIKDIVQEIFIKTYVNIQSFKIDRKFSSWLYSIAHNELVNALRKKRVKTLPLLELDTFLPHSYIAEGLDKEIDRQITKEIMERCLDQMDFKYRETIALYYFDELSYKEIAEVMKVPISTVGIRMKRAKEIIKEICNNSNHKL